MLRLKGHFRWRSRRSGIVVAEGRVPNGITDPALNDLLDVYFRSGSANANWYLGLIDNDGFTAVADADTMASHSGWGEFTGYSEATRQQWSPSAASSQNLDDEDGVLFTITAGGNIQGFFVCSNSTKGGTTGILWSTGIFDITPREVVVGEEFTVFYDLTAKEG